MLGQVVLLLEDPGDLHLDVVGLAVPEQGGQVPGGLLLGLLLGEERGLAPGLLLPLLLEQERLLPPLLLQPLLLKERGLPPGLLLPLLLQQSLLLGGLLGAESLGDEGHDPGGQHIEHFLHHYISGLGAEAALDLR